MIEGETRYGTVRVWIAPEREFHQVRWRLVQQPHHFELFGQERVADHTWYTNEGPVQVETKTTEVEVTTFAELDGLLIPAAGVQRVLIRGKGGITLQEGEGVIRRTEIRLVAKYDEVADAFRVHIPDGTFVTNLDDPSGVQYVWRGGWVVRGHTEFTGAAQGRWQPRSIWVYVGWIVLGLATAGIALRVWYVRCSRLQQEQP